VLFSCARRDAITLPTAINKAGAHSLTHLLTYSPNHLLTHSGKAYVTGLTNINACVITHPYVIYGLGDVDNIYRIAWLIPPIIPAPPSQRGGMTINVFSGISLKSALRWGAPSITSIRSSGEKKGKVSNGDMGTLDSLGYIHVEVAVKITMQNVNIEVRTRLLTHPFTYSLTHPE
jgi:hypothetical protein